MNDKELIKEFGSWVRVQVAFYDFIFQQALEMCASCTKEMMLEGFADGEDPYEDAIKAIENKFNFFDEAWTAFKQSIKERNGDHE